MPDPAASNRPLHTLRPSPARVVPVAALLLAVAMAVVGCGGGAAVRTGPLDTPDSLSVDVIFETNQSGYEEEVQRVITDAAAWSEAWSTLTREDPSATDAPVIDFEQSMVLLAASGEQPTGGYAVEMPAAIHLVESVEVVVVHVQPGPGCFTTQSLTSPAVAVQVPRVEEPVTFNVREDPRGC